MGIPILWKMVLRLKRGTGLHDRLSNAFGKWQEFQPEMWAHNALQLSQNPLQIEVTPNLYLDQPITQEVTPNLYLDQPITQEVTPNLYLDQPITQVVTPALFHSQPTMPQPPDFDCVTVLPLASPQNTVKW